MDKLYYISQGKTANEHLKNINNVCENGCRLVQLRLKEISSKEYLEVAKEGLDICNFFNAKLIINDNVFVANEINCFGIHVGKNDESPRSIRKRLDANKIIGGTANSLEDCLNLIDQKVDYIGLGPFKYTSTKKVLSPILGIEGYQSILSELKKQGHNTPIYAIGGIELEDIDELIRIGLHGVAISSALTKATSSQNKDAQNTTKNQRYPKSLALSLSKG